MAALHDRSLRLTRVWCAVVIAAVAYVGFAVPLVASAVVVDATQAPPSPGSTPSKQCSAPYFEFWTGESGGTSACLVGKRDGTGGCRCVRLLSPLV